MPRLTPRPILLVLMLLVAACSNEADAPGEGIPVRVGETDLAVVVYEGDGPGLTFLNLHDDEDTSVEAAREVVERRGGRVISVSHTGERNVTFALDGATYVFDPNRVFTDAGARATLDTLSAEPAPANAFEAVRAFADAVLAAAGVDSLDAVVTLHNNTDDRYSTLSYLDADDLAGDAQFVHLSDDRDPDDFFFVTDADLYNALREANFNVVLQDNANVTDDGSLSVHAARAGVPYVNVEAQHGHFDEQVEMIEVLVSILSER